MRKLILLFTFSMTLILKSNAQFLEVGDKWIFVTNYHSLEGDFKDKIDSIEIQKDTLINGLEYFKMVASEDSPCQIFGFTEYLREADDRIYRLSKDYSKENLMIDFTNQTSYDMIYEAASEEIQTTVFNDSIGMETLPSGESLEFIYQRIINNSSYGDEMVFTLSKELGYFQYGLLFPDIGTGLCDVTDSINLRCKISANDTIRVTDLDCYETSLTSSTINVDTEHANIYPNPSTGILSIDGDYEILAIQNISGIYMKFTNLNNEIDISHFPAGLYFVTLKREYDEKIQSYKIIKM